MSVVEVSARLRQEVGKAVVGQERAIDQVLVAILANGHILLEGVPGIAKTLLVRTMAKALALDFTRIQFTPDLMPSDVIGTNVFDPKTTDFRLRKGPVFTQILLADEINRTPPKTQAALLEAMEERQVTIDGIRYPLPSPFLVFATQNPIEFEGTYPLPEAQQDRFLLKVLLEYPPGNVEVEVLKRFHLGFRSQNLEQAGVQAIVDLDGLASLRQEVEAVQIEERIFQYVYDLVASTRKANDILVGASPRAGLALVACSKAVASLRGRNFVIPDDVKELALPILRHRVLLRPEAEVEGLTVDRVLTSLVDAQVVPR
ncbi:MAG TPA: MoxR family ATPase [Fimbriimonadaceae bacterium]|nr:MoxR family ATPase [Fimbriimonadaceae bacterium]